MTCNRMARAPRLTVIDRRYRPVRARGGHGIHPPVRRACDHDQPDRKRHIAAGGPLIRGWPRKRVDLGSRARDSARNL
jgi:hypothetical protein